MIVYSISLSRVAAVIIFLFAGTYGMGISRDTKPIIVAHRGFSSQHPENTISAFSAAIGLADMIEFDIAFSQDRQIIVMHDATIDRTTDGNGRVHKFTLAQLKSFDAGSWFDASFAHEKIPTLNEVLHAVSHQIACNIEIKREAFEYAEVEDIADASVSLVQEYGVLESTIFSSFDHESIARLKKYHPEATIYLLFDAKPEDRKLLASSNLILYIKNKNASGINIDKALLNQDLVDRLHAHNIQIGVFTINSLSTAQQCIAMGVDLIYTDSPDVLIQRSLPSKS